MITWHCPVCKVIKEKKWYHKPLYTPAPHSPEEAAVAVSCHKCKWTGYLRMYPVGLAYTNKSGVLYTCETIFADRAEALPEPIGPYAEMKDLMNQASEALDQGLIPPICNVMTPIIGGPANATLEELANWPILLKSVTYWPIFSFRKWLAWNYYTKQPVQIPAKTERTSHINTADERRTSPN